MRLSSERRKKIVREEISSRRTHITLRGLEALGAQTGAPEVECTKKEAKPECLLKLHFHHYPYVAIDIEINEDENDKFSCSVTLAPLQEPDRPMCLVVTVLVTQYTISIIGQGWFKAVRLQ